MMSVTRKSEPGVLASTSIPAPEDSCVFSRSQKMEDTGVSLTRIGSSYRLEELRSEVSNETSNQAYPNQQNLLEVSAN